VLFPDDIVVLDEAHTVPEVATDHFGLRLSSYGMDRLLKYLYNPRTKRGLLSRHGGPIEQQLVADALEASEQFFGFIGDQLLAKQAIVRVREEGVAEPYLDGPLLALVKAVGRIADKFEEGKERDELLEQRDKLKTYQTGLNQWLGVGDAQHVYWAERSGRRQTLVTLRTAPLDVAPYLREQLFRRGVAVVCTSATLALGEQIDIFRQRVGADEARAVVVRSPFDFERNMRVYVAADVPLPSPQDARLALDALADWVRFCTLRTAGGSLVLFTSYADLRQVAATLEPDFAAARRPLLLHGAELSRTELAKSMRARGNAILFGTDSFWTGVDVPGDALSQVIITRLPFDPPTHPILEARAEHIRDAGGNPFNELTLPDALIKFRQGVGRLIRTATDRGVVTILDARVLAKTYGRLFLEVLPQPEYERITRENREQRFHPYV
jgi:ATP-dependent DNA helicase DinG